MPGLGIGVGVGFGRPRRRLMDIGLDGLLIPSGLTFSRSGTATYINSAGLIASAAGGVARMGAYAPGGTVPGILMEGSRTNVLANPTLAGGLPPTSWTTLFATGSFSLVTSTLGTADGAQAIEYTTSSSRAVHSQTCSLSSNTTYTASCYLESNTGIQIQDIITVTGLPSGATISAWYVNGATATSSSIPDAGSWCSLVISGTYTGGSVTFRVGNGCNTGNTTGVVKLSRPQLEAGTFRSSFITSASRNAETCYLTLTSAQAAILSVGGTMVVEYTLVGGDSTNSSGSRIYASIDDGYSSNRVTAYNASGAVGSLVITETAAQANTVKAGTIAANSKSKIACSWAANSFNVAAGGGSGTRDPSGSVPSVARLGIGGASYGSGQAYAIIHRITIYANSTESDTALAALST